MFVALKRSDCGWLFPPLGDEYMTAHGKYETEVEKNKMNGKKQKNKAYYSKGERGERVFIMRNQVKQMGHRGTRGRTAGNVPGLFMPLLRRLGPLSRLGRFMTL